MANANNIGLKARIGQAESVDAINALLREGSNYHHRSPKTDRQWGRVAMARLARLNAPKPKRKPKAA
jgi:hypothetical protein